MKIAQIVLLAVMCLLLLVQLLDRRRESQQLGAVFRQREAVSGAIQSRLAGRIGDLERAIADRPVVIVVHPARSPTLLLLAMASGLDAHFLLPYDRGVLTPAKSAAPCGFRRASQNPQFDYRSGGDQQRY